MVIRSAFFIILIMGLFSCSKSDSFKKEEWIFLFNGTDLSDWTIKFANREIGVNHLNTFRVQDSMIRIAYDKYNTFEDAYAHIYYKKPYSYYKLRFDYRFTGEQVPGVKGGMSATAVLCYIPNLPKAMTLVSIFPFPSKSNYWEDWEQENARLETFVHLVLLWSWMERSIIDTVFLPNPKPITATAG